MAESRHTNLPDDLDPELESTVKALDEAVDRISPDSAFTSRLEHSLTGAHPGSEVRSMPIMKKLMPALLVVLAAAVLVVVVDWMIRSLAPPPVPAAGGTPGPRGTETFNPTLEAQPTPAPQIKSVTTYPWRGITLAVDTELPGSPSQSEVYMGQPYAHATPDEALALAQRFGIQGIVYQARGELPGTTDYVVSDGKQSLRVRSEGYVEYLPDVARAYNHLFSVQIPDAEQIIGAFLESHGYAFPHRVQWSEFRGAYMVEPLAADGTPLRYEFYSQPMMAIYLDEDGSVFRVLTSLLKLAEQPAGQVGIISAEDALQRVLDPNRTSGILESMHSAVLPLHEWKRSFSTDQPLTIYGYVTSMQPVDPAQAPLVQLDGYPLAGQIAGLDQLSDPSYVAATGRFAGQDGVVRFVVDSWELSRFQDDGLSGTLRRDNDQVILTTVDGEHVTLVDVPADIPMPFENAYVVGTRIGDIFEWKSIDDRSLGGGGGGGGGGVGFYKLNLSGTPVAFPTATMAPSGAGLQYTVQEGDTLSKIAAGHGTDVDTLIRANGLANPGLLGVGQVITIPGSADPNSPEQPLEGLRGMLNITVSKQLDGSQLVNYGFQPMNGGPYMILEGAGLDQLQQYNSRPVDVWGTMQLSAAGAISTARVDRFEIPFPDLRVQVLQGTQKLAQLDRQPATLFTASDGTTYVQLTEDGMTASSLIGNEGDEVLIECVTVPGETHAGYPALRIFGGMLAIDPKSGLHVTLPITRDQPTILEVQDAGRSTPPNTATIENVELVHFVSDPRFLPAGAAPGQLYLQPAWRFSGHYSNGDGFEILVQAAQQQFLLPEVEPAVQPG